MHKIRKKLERNILIYLSAIIVTFLIFSGSLFIVLIDRNFYDTTFQKYGAYEKIGVEGIRNTADAIISYLLHNIENINASSELMILTQNERSHMEDVHSIFNKVKYLSAITLGVLLVLILRMRANGTLRTDIRKVLKYSGIKILIALATVFFVSINFEWFFTEFHHIFFPQGNWLFPSDSLLIIMFPQQFYEDYIAKMFMHVLVAGLFLLFAGLFLEMWNKHPAATDKKKAKKRR